MKRPINLLDRVLVTIPLLELDGAAGRIDSVNLRAQPPRFRVRLTRGVMVTTFADDLLFADTCEPVIA